VRNEEDARRADVPSGSTLTEIIVINQAGLIEAAQLKLRVADSAVCGKRGEAISCGRSAKKDGPIRQVGEMRAPVHGRSRDGHAPVVAEVDVDDGINSRLVVLVKDGDIEGATAGP
jgi:hypothetical protein